MYIRGQTSDGLCVSIKKSFLSRSTPPPLIHSFSIVTTRANTFMAEIHDRMPVILAAQAEQHWLDLVHPYVAVAGLLRPYEQNVLVANEEPPSEVRQLNLFG